MEKNEMGVACSTYGGEERCIQDLVGKTEGKRPLGRPRLRWEDKIDLQDMGRGAWTGLICLSVGTGGGGFVNAVMNFRVP
jgi:hypothetical protein